MKLSNLKSELESLKDPKRAEVSAWFFKTGPGQYGEGDVFLGITVPVQREVAKKYLDLTLVDLLELLRSKIHEHRFIAVIILVYKFNKTDENGKKKIFDFYIKNAKNVNNWDLVDASAEYIVGEYLSRVDSIGLRHAGSLQNDILVRLARSKNLWERRIAIVSTFGFIKKGRFDDTFKVAEILLSDSHDLIHKAVGWMLREVGKRDQKVLEVFLSKHYRVMPRTTLRYAIERFDSDKKRFYMSKIITN